MELALSLMLGWGMGIAKAACVLIPTPCPNTSLARPMIGQPKLSRQPDAPSGGRRAGWLACGEDDREEDLQTSSPVKTGKKQ